MVFHNEVLNFLLNAAGEKPDVGLDCETPPTPTYYNFKNRMLFKTLGSMDITKYLNDRKGSKCRGIGE